MMSKQLEKIEKLQKELFAKAAHADKVIAEKNKKIESLILQIKQLKSELKAAS